MKNRRGAEKRRCQRHKTLDDPPGLCDCRCRWYLAHIGDFLLSSPTGMSLVLGPHWDSFLSRFTGTLWFIWAQPWGRSCSRSEVSSLCWPRRTQWPQRRHTGWRLPYSGLWICLQKPALASWQRGQPSQRLPPVQPVRRWSGFPVQGLGRQGLPAGDGGHSGRLRGARDFDSRLAGNPRPFQSVRAAGLGGLPC